MNPKPRPFMQPPPGFFRGISFFDDPAPKLVAPPAALSAEKAFALERLQEEAKAWEYVQQRVEHYARMEAERLEAEVLAGCYGCGRPMLYDGVPAIGATIIQPQDEVIGGSHPYCGLCVNELFNIGVFKEPLSDDGS